MTSTTNKTIVQLAELHNVGKAKDLEFYVNSDKFLETTIDEYSEIPCEHEESVGRALPSTKYNHSDKLLCQKGQVKEYLSDKTIVSLNSDGQSTVSIGQDGIEDFSKPLCAHRKYQPSDWNQYDSDNDASEESDDIFDLSESCASELFDNLISSRRSSSEF